MSDISFDNIYTEYRERLLKTVGKKVKDQTEAEDIVQECMLKVYTNLDKYDSKYALSTWIYTIAFNTINNYYRQSGRLPQITSVTELYDNDHTLSYDSPENILISEQTKSKVDQAVSSMNSAYLEALTLKDDDGMSVKEVATTLAIPINTAKSRIRRAREHIHKALS